MSIATKFWNNLIANNQDCFSTISEASKDTTNGIVLCASNHLVIDFDNKLIPKLIPKSDDPKAVDMLHIHNSNINLVEFKNGTFKNHDIKLKSIESLIFLFKILNKMNLVNDFKELFSLNINFYLVYNDTVHPNLPNSSSTRIRARITNNSYIASFYPNYEGTYFSKIKIMPSTYFLNNYINTKFI